MDVDRYFVAGAHLLALKEIIAEPPIWEISLNGVLIGQTPSLVMAEAIFELMKRALEAADHA